ncbi:MAG: hypothetical protein JSU61_09735 [Fidelibacterota bacterium]|nr:MAG: hypothetical protein JSU61_09735 [Candidatus Neomarinimicrobiota bacterium]
MFEPEKLHFNVIDLLGAPRRALKGNKIGAHLIGLIAGYPGYFVLTYIAFWVDGQSFSTMWDRYGLYPFFPLTEGVITHPGAWVVYALGLLLWLVATLLAATLVARITYKELKGDPFYALHNGLAFTKQHWRVVIFSPITMILILAFFLAMAVLMALVGKIPFVGEVIFVGFLPIYFAGAIFTLFSAVVLVVLILYIPAIVALWEDDTVGSTFQAYAITWNHIWRVVIYSGIIALLTVIAVMVYGTVLTLGYRFITWVFTADWLMGEKLAPILAWAEQIVFSSSTWLNNDWVGLILSSSTKLNSIDPAAATGWQAFIGSLVALILLLIYGSAWAYGLAIISVGQCLSFLIYKFKTDHENLLEQRDEEEVETEQQADPSAGETAAGEDLPTGEQNADPLER